MESKFNIVTGYGMVLIIADHYFATGVTDYSLIHLSSDYDTAAQEAREIWAADLRAERESGIITNNPDTFWNDNAWGRIWRTHGDYWSEYVIMPLKKLERTGQDTDWISSISGFLWSAEGSFRVVPEKTQEVISLLNKYALTVMHTDRVQYEKTFDIITVTGRRILSPSVFGTLFDALSPIAERGSLILNAVDGNRMQYFLSDGHVSLDVHYLIKPYGELEFAQSLPENIQKAVADVYTAKTKAAKKLQK